MSLTNEEVRSYREQYGFDQQATTTKETPEERIDRLRGDNASENQAVSQTEAFNAIETTPAPNDTSVNIPMLTLFLISIVVVSYVVIKLMRYFKANEINEEVIKKSYISETLTTILGFIAAGTAIGLVKLATESSQINWEVVSLCALGLFALGIAGLAVTYRRFFLGFTIIFIGFVVTLAIIKWAFTFLF